MALITVSTEARWAAPPKGIISVLALSGVLSEVLGGDVIIDDPHRAGMWDIVGARSRDPDELLEIWLLDCGSFTEAALTLRVSRTRRPGGVRELKRRLEGFCAQVENALGSDPSEQPLGRRSFHEPQPRQNRMKRGNPHAAPR